MFDAIKTGLAVPPHPVLGPWIASLIQQVSRRSRRLVATSFTAFLSTSGPPPPPSGADQSTRARRSRDLMSSRPSTKRVGRRSVRLAKRPFRTGSAVPPAADTVPAASSDRPFQGSCARRAKCYDPCGRPRAPVISGSPHPESLTDATHSGFSHPVNRWH
jgi:hypothetical protein